MNLRMTSNVKEEIIHVISISFIKHLNYMLKNKDESYLNENNSRGTSKKEGFEECIKLLESSINLPNQKVKFNIIKRFSKKVEMDYPSIDFFDFSMFFTKRILDLYFGTNQTRKNLIKELLLFKYENHELNLTTTIRHENAMREVLRKICFKYHSDSWSFILDQSNAIQTTFVKYFEDILKNASDELKVLNNNLEEKVEKKTKELLYNLYTDKLTRIPNMNSFVKDSQKYDKQSVVLFNIDGFRKINSIYGYNFSDKILEKITKKINEKVLTCGNFKLYRYHGDWFIILETNKNKLSIPDLYNKILSLFSKENLEVNDEKLSISFTAGVAINTEEPIKYAELAYQKAKEKRTLYEIYDDDTSVLEEYKKHQHVLQTIKNAIDNDLVFPHFQLIRDNKNPNNKKYESLMRIRGFMGNMFSPFIFLEIAKDAKLYSSLAKMMMKKSIQKFENIDATFSINLEVEDVLNFNTMNYLFDLIQKYKVENKIILEITESENINDFNEVSKIFKRFKDLGVKVAIDDFGTGYSNFSYLTEFNFDFIKIDGSLIKNIHTDKNSFIIVQMIVDFAKRLNKQVIAEFIENEEIQEVIEELGIEYSQGYLFSKPSLELI